MKTFLKDYNVFYIEQKDDGKVLRDFLRDGLKLSHRTLIKLKNSKAVSLNGDHVWLNKVLKAGDKLEITLSEEESENILPEAMELDIVYEDEYLIIINKPYGMPVHPTRNHFMGTLANGLVHYWMGKERSTVIRPVIRLDKDTTGLVVFAKNSHIQHLLSLNMGTSDFYKEYTAIVHGNPIEDSGTIDLPIARDNPYSVKRVVREDGDRSITHFEVVERYPASALLEINLETGRTHQIRVHMSHIGHPLMGDELYGGTNEQIKRHALHAGKISMLHPIKNIRFDFVAPIPEDMEKLIKALRGENGL